MQIFCHHTLDARQDEDFLTLDLGSESCNEKQQHASFFFLSAVQPLYRSTIEIFNAKFLILSARKKALFITITA